jgi:release factor glutamine methyltransferase
MKSSVRLLNGLCEECHEKETIICFPVIFPCAIRVKLLKKDFNIFQRNSFNSIFKEWVVILGMRMNINIDDQIFKNIVGILRLAGCVFAEEEARLLIAEAMTLEALSTMVKHRITGIPLEYVIGWAEFCGNRILVDKGVFVPRRRTEFLVQKAVEISAPGAVVVDLCCGTGAVGVAIAKALDRIELYAVDIDPTTVRCAIKNVLPVGGCVFEGDLYVALPVILSGKVDIIVANAPYVPSEAIRLLPQDSRLYESKAALDGGNDGLDIQRRVVEGASLWLSSGGHLLIETSKMQAHQTFEIFTKYGLIPQLTYCDELEATVVIGTKPTT